MPSRGVTALFGRSGAGKSSVVNLLAGLLEPDDGYVKVDDTVLFDSADGLSCRRSSGGSAMCSRKAGCFLI